MRERDKGEMKMIMLGLMLLGIAKAGPAKSNELIACRDPVGAAVL